MSLIPVQVELPQYAQSFSINVPINGSILDIKEEISRSVPGKPRVEGQRLIAQGRVLSDSEVVDQLWKSAEDARVIHLAVNPTSWTTGPPELGKISAQAAASSSSSTSPALAVQDLPNLQPSLSDPPQTNTSSRTVLSRHPDLAYLRIQHHNALQVLQNKAPATISSRRQYVRNQSYTAVVNAGFSWPSILDEEYPQDVDGVSGAEYTTVTIDGRNYLQLETPSRQPSPRQLHALKVLTRTFPLLSAPIPVLGYVHGVGNDLRYSLPNHQILANAFAPGQPYIFGDNANANIINNINNALNANANGAAAAGAPVRAVVQIREVPVRALLTPLFLLFLRTLLLFYFISPARKPLIGIMLGAWVLYEAWGAVRGAIGDLNELARNADPQPRANRPGNIPLGQQGAGAAPNAGQGPAAGNPAPTPTQPAQPHASNVDILLTRVSTLNLDSEAATLNVSESGRPAEEPNVFQKARIFVSLIVLTLHPAVWNRRRLALRQREGRLRTEGRARMADVGGEGGQVDERAVMAREQMAQAHSRRPRWVREYVERVMLDEWIDD